MGAMITFRFNDGDVEKQVRKALGPLETETPSVMKNALNAAARKARNLLDDQVKKTYAMPRSGMAKEMRLQNATKSRLMAIIHADGPVTELIHFTVDPHPAVRGHGETVPEMIKAKVLQSGSLKDLYVDGRKAFFIRFKSGHVTIAQRKGKARLPVKTLYAPSFAKLVGSPENVWGVVEPHIKKILDDEIHKQIERTLRKVAKSA